MLKRLSGWFVALGVAAGIVAPAARAADTYTADPVHSAVVFRVKHMNTSHAWGRFNDITGSFSLNEADPSQSVLDFSIKAASIDTANAKRDQHLKGPDFFNVVQFPTIKFKSKSVTKSADGYEVSGELTLHGQTKPIQVKITPTGTGKGPSGTAIAGIDATFFVKQSQFGMTKMVGPIGDDVWVNVSIEGMKK
ncbi:YceI family protein [Singulisphaera sp. PoT]|uniref:YceI family protein n=1 Tax=Singulisphaera sp. PoT TaxID=3411797 RepID=UPI003BF56EBC